MTTSEPPHERGTTSTGQRHRQERRLWGRRPAARDQQDGAQTEAGAADAPSNGVADEERLAALDQAPRAHKVLGRARLGVRAGLADLAVPVEEHAPGDPRDHEARE